MQIRHDGKGAWLNGKLSTEQYFPTARIDDSATSKSIEFHAQDKEMVATVGSGIYSFSVSPTVAEWKRALS